MMNHFGTSGERERSSAMPEAGGSSAQSPWRTVCERLTALLFTALLGSGAGSARAKGSCPYFGAPPGALETVKTRLAKGEPTLQPALRRLMADADLALSVPPPSVMDKTQTPPSGDKHDYMSTAPYFWPDATRSNGLPYLRHDGRVNPESRDPGASDHNRFGRMASNVETLALAFYFTGNSNYAAHAAECLRSWFLNPATRMNPNLNFAQAVPGVNQGRGTGIIEGRGLAQAADAAQLLAGSAAWTSQDQESLRTWLAHYLDWLTTSRAGQQEAAARNNHGTWYDVQVVHLALVLHRPELARRISQTAKQKRIAAQIQPDGRQPLELSRTSSFGYSRFNLDALFALATLAQYVEVDLWHYSTSDGCSIRKALDFLLPYLEPPAKDWPFQQLHHFDPATAAPLLRQAAIVYAQPRYEQILHMLGNLDSGRFQLLRPLTAPAQN